MDANQIAHFEEITRKIFDNWTLLTLAVEGGWGGRDSRQKKETFIDSTLDLFSPHTGGPSVEALEDFFKLELSKNFNCESEDFSEVEVAELLVRLHRGLRSGDTTIAKTVLGHVAAPLESSREARCLEGHDSSDSSSESETDEFRMEDA